MKKLAVASAVLAVMVSSAAFANVSLDVYSERVTNAKTGFFGDSSAKQGAIIGFSPIENVSFCAEATTAKDLDLGAAYTFEISEHFYVKPQMGYVAKFGKSKDINGKIDFKEDAGNSIDSFHVTGVKSDVAKFGLETGANFGEFFTSVRYRVDYDVTPFSIDVKGKKDGKAHKENLAKERSQIGRTDLLVGYHFDAVTLTAKAIHKAELNKDLKSNGDFGKKVNSALKGTDCRYGYDSNWTSEVKATFTSFDGVAPYVQYAHNHQNSDNAIKLGAKFAF
ncbi:hypothetical protein [Vibrio coralliirubri]|uniref:hypothetical protein n=1 Tax=Vibrio coralliirubri TaxID=1516159 RepID=UPI000A3CD503|nr:hypothetical protein [Vibrio coralliirubri]